MCCCSEATKYGFGADSCDKIIIVIGKHKFGGTRVAGYHKVGKESRRIGRIGDERVEVEESGEAKRSDAGGEAKRSDA